MVTIHVLPIFSFFFSLSSIKLQQTSMGKKAPAPPPNPTPPPNTATQYRELTQNQHRLTTTQSPPPQPIQTHDIPITKSTKNKEKSNQESNLQWKTQQLRTQNQTFNKKPINPNPNSNQGRCHHCHGEVDAFFARGELAAAIREERNKC